MTLAVIVYKLLLIQTAQEDLHLTDETDIFESKKLSVIGGMGLQQEEEERFVRPKSAKLPAVVALEEEEVTVI